MRRTVPPSTDIQSRIDALLAEGVPANDAEGALSQLARLGAQLIIQRAVEDELDAWLGRARYERRPEAPPGKRNGYRPRRLQTAEGELEVEMPQVREAAEPFVSRLFPYGTRLLRTEPLKAMVVGAAVGGSGSLVNLLSALTCWNVTASRTATRLCAVVTSPENPLHHRCARQMLRPSHHSPALAPLQNRLPA